MVKAQEQTDQWNRTQSPAADHSSPLTKEQGDTVRDRPPLQANLAETARHPHAKRWT